MSADLNIDATTGRANVVSFRQSMWHGMGTVVQEEMSDDDVLRLAGMNWDVTKEPVYRRVGEQYVEVEGHRALVRDGAITELAVVGADYRPFQNRELVQLMRQLATRAESGLVWETAGILGKSGQTVWCQARLPGLRIALGNDVTDCYWLIRNGHGNAYALTLLPTTIRVVCQNTMTAASGSAGADRERMVSVEEVIETQEWSMPRLAQGFSVMHSGRMDEALKRIVDAYATAEEAQRKTKEVYERLAAVSVTNQEAAEYWEQIFALPAAEDESQRARTLRENKERTRREVMQRIWSSPTNLSVDTANTAYTAWQSAVEYIDHDIYAHNARTRFNSAVAGNGAKLKKDAWEVAGELFLATV